MATRYWQNTTGDLTSVTAWNTARDGSGSSGAPANSDTLIWDQGSQSVTTNLSGLSAVTGLTVRVTRGYSGSIGTSVTPLETGTGLTLYYGGLCPIAHFRPGSATLVTCYATSEQDSALTLSGGGSQKTITLARLVGGRIHAGTNIKFTSCIVEGPVYMTDEAGVEYVSIQVDHSDAFVDSQNNPKNSSNEGALEIGSKGGTVVCRGSNRFDFRMSNGTLRYLGSGDTRHSYGRRGTFDSRDNQYGFQVGAGSSPVVEFNRGNGAFMFLAPNTGAVATFLVTNPWIGESDPTTDGYKAAYGSTSGLDA